MFYFVVKDRALTTSRFRLITILAFNFSPFSPPSTLHTFTSLSAPPVAIHPRTCGFTSRAETAPVCADSVNLDLVGVEGILDGMTESVRVSKEWTFPFSRDT